jgi:glycosyltransferase involved in cell wall biosynthesis
LGKPFVSVLIDTYNHERFIEQAIVSVLEQDFPASEREILVVDDGSTDRTPEIVRKFAPQVRLLRKENGGQASAFNAGIPECQGEIIAFLDGDDWWAAGKLRSVAEVFISDPSIGIVGHGIIESFQDGTLRTTALDRLQRFRLDSPTSAKLFCRNRAFFGTSRLTLRSEIARKILPVPEALIFEADEYVFTVGAALSEAIILNAALTYYRIHGGNLFLAADRTPIGQTRKEQVLASLAVELRRAFDIYGISRQVTRPILEIVEAEAAQLRLKSNGGWPWETFAVESRLYRFYHPDAHFLSRVFRSFSMILALLLPPTWFYSGRQWLGSQHWYIRSRKSVLPSPILRNDGSQTVSARTGSSP